MNQQQKNTLEQFAMQNKYDLNKMSVDNVYRLAQMAQQNGYDVGMMGMQQQFQSGQNALDRDHSWNMQGSQQGFQSGQNALDRDQQMNMQFNGFQHDQSMFSAKQLADTNAMEQAMQTELSSYTDKNSDAYKLREAQLKSSVQALHVETNAKLLADIGGKWFADKVGNVPVHPGKKASKAEIDKYNNKLDSYNNSVNSFLTNPANVETFIQKIDKAPYNAETKKKANNFFTQFWQAGNSMNPGGLP